MKAKPLALIISGIILLAAGGIVGIWYAKHLGRAQGEAQGKAMKEAVFGTEEQNLRYAEEALQRAKESEQRLRELDAAAEK